MPPSEEERVIAILNEVDPASAHAARDAFTRAKDGQVLKDVAATLLVCTGQQMEAATAQNATIAAFTEAMREANAFRHGVLQVVQSRWGFASVTLVCLTVLITHGYGQVAVDLIRSLAPLAHLLGV